MAPSNPPLTSNPNEFSAAAGSAPDSSSVGSSAPPTQMNGAVLRSVLQSRSKIFVTVLFCSLLLGMLRYFWPLPTNWMLPLLSLGLFVVGALIAPLVFVLEFQWLNWLQENVGLRLASAQRSPIRNGIILLGIPLVGAFVLSSSRAPVGLGFLWGISAWYAVEVWQMIQHNQNLATVYFSSRNVPLPRVITNILLMYLAYFALLTLGLILI